MGDPTPGQPPEHVCALRFLEAISTSVPEDSCLSKGTASHGIPTASQVKGSSLLQKTACSKIFTEESYKIEIVENVPRFKYMSLLPE